MLRAFVGDSGRARSATATAAHLMMRSMGQGGGQGVNKEVLGVGHGQIEEIEVWVRWGGMMS